MWQEGQLKLTAKILRECLINNYLTLEKKDVGFIFQDYNVLHTLTVRENIMLPLSITKLSRQEAEMRYQEVTEALGITEIGSKYPDEISGGQNNVPQQPVH